MAAHDATLSESLALLRGAWASTTDAVLRNRIVFWVGSRVSASRFPPIRELLLLLLEELFRSQNGGNPDCIYRAATREIVRMTTFRSDPDIDIAKSPSSWPNDKRLSLLEQLENQYAQVFNIPLQIVGGASLAWDFLKLQNLYGDAAVLPDAEHRFLALLIAEGAVSEIITTNWDPLIERAYTALGCAPPLEIVACTEELNRAGEGALIFKIHGCAERMRMDGTRYRPHMVVSGNDINHWAVEPFFMAFREQVRALLRARPSIFVGISGQDFNLQAQFVASVVGGVKHNFDPPRVAFTVTEIGPPQRAILAALYGDEYAANAALVNEKAKILLYGKPLLGALFVLLLLRKLECFLALGGDQFPLADLRALATQGVQWLEASLTAQFDAIADSDNRWRMLAAELPRFISRTLGLFRDQRVPGTPEMYQPLDTRHPGAMLADLNLASANLHWLFLANVLFEYGRRQGIWGLITPSLPTGEDGQFRVTIGGNDVTIFLLNRPDVSQQRLESNGVIQPGSGRNALLVYPAGAMPVRLRRSPTRTLPTASVTRTASEVWLQEMADESSTTADLLDMLRSALITAQPL